MANRNLVISFGGAEAPASSLDAPRRIEARATRPDGEGPLPHHIAPRRSA